MQRISSQTTFLLKRIFPVLWFGVLALLLAMALRDAARNGHAPFVPVIVLLSMTLWALFLFKTLILTLADEVWDAGDALVVRNKGREERIMLSERVDFSYWLIVNPPRLTLSLRQPTTFGRKISFILPTNDFTVGDDLIRRIKAARMRAR
jgi:hypothetical protein